MLRGGGKIMKKLCKNKTGFVFFDAVGIILALLALAFIPLPTVKIQKAIRSEVKANLSAIRSAEKTYKLKYDVYTNANLDQVRSLLGVDITDPHYCDAACYDVTGVDTKHFTARCTVNNVSAAPGATQVLRYFPGTVFTMDQAGRKADRIQ